MQLIYDNGFHVSLNPLALFLMQRLALHPFLKKLNGPAWIPFGRESNSDPTKLYL